MKFDKKLRRISAGAALVGVLAIGAVAYGAPPDGKGGGKGGGKPPKGDTTTTVVTTAPPTTSAPTTPPSTTYNEVDSEFVAMMIPHHFQATVMSELAPDRSGDDQVKALADRIDVEQEVEIGMMQNWQTWNGLPVTDAPSSYEMMLGNPMMVEMMGMATAEEMDDLAASSGTEFDRLYLELMIDHHQGAIGMFENVILNGSDQTLEFWANDMMSGQMLQIDLMEAMLAELG